MSAIRARTLDQLLADVFAQADTTIYLRQAFRDYEEAVRQAPRLVLAWHHIRMGLRVLTSGKELP